MYLRQADLFNGVSMYFVQQVMALTAQETHSEGEVLFRCGEPADHFYILIRGCVKLTLTDTDQKVYIGCQTGETFGWSSLVGGDVYTATAECLEPTHLLRIERDKFQRILNRDSESGFILYKNLAKSLGSRLVNSYRMISDSPV